MDKFVTKSSLTIDSMGSKAKVKKRWLQQRLRDHDEKKFNADDFLCKMCSKWPNMVLLSFFLNLALQRFSELIQDKYLILLCKWLNLHANFGKHIVLSNIFVRPCLGYSAFSQTFHIMPWCSKHFCTHACFTMFNPNNKTHVSSDNSKVQNMFYNSVPVTVSTEDLKETVKPLVNQ